MLKLTRNGIMHNHIERVDRVLLLAVENLWKMARWLRPTCRFLWAGCWV